MWLKFYVYYPFLKGVRPTDFQQFLFASFLICRFLLTKDDTWTKFELKKQKEMRIKCDFD